MNNTYISGHHFGDFPEIIRELLEKLRQDFLIRRKREPDKNSKELTIAAAFN